MTCFIQFPTGLFCFYGIELSFVLFISKCNNFVCSYEPELFPGLIYRMVKPRIVLLIFVSGKVVLTGKCKIGSFINRTLLLTFFTVVTIYLFICKLIERKFIFYKVSVRKSCELWPSILRCYSSK